MEKIFKLVKNFIMEFLFNRYPVDERLSRVTEDYSIIKQKYQDMVQGDRVIDQYSDASVDKLISSLSDYLIMVDSVRLSIMDLLIGSCESTARSHVNAMLVDVSSIQEELEFLLSKYGVIHTNVIEPPRHDGMIKYWRNMNAKHSVNASLLTLAIFC